MEKHVSCRTHRENYSDRQIFRKSPGTNKNSGRQRENLLGQGSDLIKITEFGEFRRELSRIQKTATGDGLNDPDRTDNTGEHAMIGDKRPTLQAFPKRGGPYKTRFV